MPRAEQDVHRALSCRRRPSPQALESDDLMYDFVDPGDRPETAILGYISALAGRSARVFHADR